MRIAAVIVAAGRGTRAGGPVAKQWQPLFGRPVVDWTVDAFRALPEIGAIALVLPPDEMSRADHFFGVIAVPGGAHRAASVAAGLEALEAHGGADHVLIHDAARPLVSQDLILSVIDALKEAPGAAPGLPVTDALWRETDGRVSGVADRGGLIRAQTPQGFHFGPILAAHRHFAADAAVAMADDVEMARAAGLEVVVVPGSEDNLKITRPEDFARAETLMRGMMDIRVGNGFDVHRFGPGDHVILCGVRVPHGHGLVGHSDADVAMHAVTDALYGALAAGDIGQHFPPSDPKWKGADSRIFLEHAVDLAAERGYVPSGIDLTLICEDPKIGPHAPAMKRKLSEITGLETTRVGVKATTTERLGFTGRGEGIAALATVTLVSA